MGKIQLFGMFTRLRISSKWNSSLGKSFYRMFPYGASGRIENLTLEVSLVEIDPFGASFVHVNDFGMIEPE